MRAKVHGAGSKPVAQTALSNDPQVMFQCTVAAFAPGIIARRTTRTPSTIPSHRMASTQDRLAALRRKKDQCKQSNAATLAREQKLQRARANPNSVSDAEDNSEREEEGDRLDWTATEWEAWDLKQGRQGATGGYKNLTDLAFSTYQKATSKQVVDKEKYRAHLAREGNAAPFVVVAEREDVEKLSRSLHEASETRLKRRRKEENAGSYITEKNRQFNMKLEREYGSD